MLTPTTPFCGDCNVNGIPDGCDFISGFSQDDQPPADGDGVPDANATPPAPKPAPSPQPAAAAPPPQDSKAILPQAVPVELGAHTVRPTPVSALAASPVAPIVAISGYRQILIYHLDDRRLAFRRRARLRLGVFA